MKSPCRTAELTVYIIKTPPVLTISRTPHLLDRLRVYITAEDSVQSIVLSVGAAHICREHLPPAEEGWNEGREEGRRKE